jgi:sulfonate transport system substrate-binding protein
MNRFVVAAAAAVVSVGLAGNASAEPAKIRIGWNQAPGHMASMTWHDTGAPYLKNHGKSYVAEPIRFQGSGHQVTAIAAGQVDIAAVSVVAFLAMINKAKVDARVVADVLQDPCNGEGFTQPFYARKDSGIKTLADLGGKRIAINSRGSAHDMMVSAAINRGGVDPKSVTRVEMKFAAMVPFLKEGKVDVGGYLPQFVPPVASDPSLFRLFTACDVIGPSATVMLVAKKEFVDANRDALVDMFADHMRAVRWFYDPANRDKMLEVVADVTKAPKENFADYVFTKDDFFRSPDLRVDPGAVQNTIDKALEFGAITEADRLVVNPGYIDYSVIEAAKKQVEG